VPYSQLCHAWKGGIKQGSLIGLTDRCPQVAKGVRVLNCVSLVSPEQLPWLPLFWSVLIFMIFTIPFPPFFFAVCIVSSPWLGSERQSYKVA